MCHYRIGIAWFWGPKKLNPVNHKPLLPKGHKSRLVMPKMGIIYLTPVAIHRDRDGIKEKETSMDILFSAEQDLWEKRKYNSVHLVMPAFYGCYLLQSLSNNGRSICRDWGRFDGNVKGYQSSNMIQSLFASCTRNNKKKKHLSICKESFWTCSRILDILKLFLGDLIIQ